MDKQSELVDEICRLAGIAERRRGGNPALDKKEALQVLTYMRTLKEQKGRG